VARAVSELISVLDRAIFPEFQIKFLLRLVNRNQEYALHLAPRVGKPPVGSINQTIV